MKRRLEIRSYNLKPGTRAEFHRQVLEFSIPLLQRWQFDVVAYGPSLHDEDSYYLMRAYASLEDYLVIEDAFYSSDDWRQDPREAILAMIDTYATAVVEVDEAILEALRSLLINPRHKEP